MQADEVVLEIPISPIEKTLYPFLTFSSAISMPISMERIACSRVIAGPSAMFFVPQAILRSKSPGTPVIS